MRFKAIPPAPEGLAALERAWRTVPLVPEAERSCCRRLADGLAGVDPDEARRWLALMRALGAVDAGPTGYRRRRELPDVATLGSRFRERVFGVEELLEHLGSGGPAGPDDAFEAIRDDVPPWERRRNPGTWETVWRSRVGDLLAWSDLLGLVEETAGTYRLAPNVIGERGA